MLIEIQEIKKRIITLFIKTTPLIAFLIALLWLYILYPASFELMWKGRTFQLFFIWLIFIEIILTWETMKPRKIPTPFSIKSLIHNSVLFMPVIYVALTNYFGVNELITNISKLAGIQWWDSMALAIEYLVFTLFSIWIFYNSFGKKGLKDFSLPIIFLGIVGWLYIIDNIFPYGKFTPFQIIVPTTATIAAIFLGYIGYQTVLITTGTMPRLTATDPTNLARTATFDIAWPCAGIESLLIYCVITSLFLKRLPISLKRKITYFISGAIITYFINILRIVTIFEIGMGHGDFQQFHFYYGPLYSILWIILYPIIILVIQKFLPKKQEPTQEK